jgi:hypothetical protein
MGGVLSTWQLLSRYKAVRSAHQLPWGSAIGATLLPYLLAGLLAVLATGSLAVVLVLVMGRLQ